MAFYKSVSIVILAWSIFSPAAEAGGLAKAFARSAMSKVLKQDLARDAVTATKPLVRSRQVWRYTTREQAARETRYGLASGSHMTTRTTRGRAPSAETAQVRYGLPNQPQVRTTWRLPPGTPVRSNKALGGAPGVGEMTSSKRVSHKNLVRTIPLEPSRR